MTIFEFVSVAISIVLGLGVARLLSAGLDLFRHRHSTTLHWSPLVWAALIFWTQLEFWWSLFFVSQNLEVWTHTDFLGTIAFTVALFAAGSLVLPAEWKAEPLDLLAFFQSEGRWGVAAFGLALVMAFPLNYRLFGVPLLMPMNLLIVAEIVAIAALVFRPTRRKTAWLTLVFMLLHLGVLSVGVQEAFS